MQNSNPNAGTNDQQRNAAEVPTSGPTCCNSIVGGSTYSKTFYQDLFGPLDEVQRIWLRRTGTILMTPLIVALGIVAGVFELSGEWYRRCW